MRSNAGMANRQGARLPFSTLTWLGEKQENFINPNFGGNIKAAGRMHVFVLWWNIK